MKTTDTTPLPQEAEEPSYEATHNLMVNILTQKVDEALTTKILTSSQADLNAPPTRRMRSSLRQTETMTRLVKATKPSSQPALSSWAISLAFLSLPTPTPMS